MPFGMGGSSKGFPEQYRVRGERKRRRKPPYTNMPDRPPLDPVSGQFGSLDPEQTRLQGLYQIQEEFDDYLLCVGYNPHEGAGSMRTVAIAKPWRLLKTPFHGRTETVGGLELSYDYTGIGQREVTATVDGEEVTEVHKITQDYMSGDVISAVPMVRGRDRHYGYAGNDGTPLKLVDANMSARAWAVDQNAEAS